MSSSRTKASATPSFPEQRDFYEAWVDFTVKDGAGKTIAESGFLQPDGYLDPSAHSFTNRLINVKGELNDLHQIWHNRVLAYNNTIQSGRSQLVRYRFRLPKDITGQVTLTATVKYRRFNQHFIDYAMDQKPGQHYPMPIIDMATETKTFKIGDNAPVPPDPSENKEWMRWNNYGIGLLDAQQYPASVHAFERVAALRPDYADAYTNMAVVEISWEKYDDAKPNLAKALTLLPGDPRALYYRALVERNAGQIKEAIADLQACSPSIRASRMACANSASATTSSTTTPRPATPISACRASIPTTWPRTISWPFSIAASATKPRLRIESAKFADQKDDPTASDYALSSCASTPKWPASQSSGTPTTSPATSPKSRRRSSTNTFPARACRRRFPETHYPSRHKYDVAVAFSVCVLFICSCSSSPQGQRKALVALRRVIYSEVAAEDRPGHARVRCIGGRGPVVLTHNEAGEDRRAEN